MTTGIDALLREANAWQDRYSPSRDKNAEILIGELVDALTTERAKVAALEAEVAKLKTENHYAYGGRPCDAKGGCLDRSTCGDCSEPGAIELAQAEAARWREVAGELAGALGDAFQHGEIMTSTRCLNRFGAALARFKQESDQ